MTIGSKSRLLLLVAAMPLLVSDPVRAAVLWRIPIEGCPAALIAEVPDEFSNAAFSQELLDVIASNPERRSVFRWAVMTPADESFPGFSARAATLGGVLPAQGHVTEEYWAEFQAYWRNNAVGVPLSEIPGAQEYVERLSTGVEAPWRDRIGVDLSRFNSLYFEISDQLVVVNSGVFLFDDAEVPLRNTLITIYRGGCLIHFEASFFGDNWSVEDATRFALESRFHLEAGEDYHITGTPFELQ
ncbi:MAG: hypothetical protein ACFCVH_19585 [Alphaproteobacteria bacterium]